MLSNTQAQPYHGTNKLLLGIFLSVLTFFFYAQTVLSIAPIIQADLGITSSWMDTAVSITSLIAGIFLVFFGNLADRIGRVRTTIVGIFFSIISSLLIALSPAGTANFLLAGRIIQGLSIAYILPATLALIKTYYEGTARHLAVSWWAIAVWVGGALCAPYANSIAISLGWRWIFYFNIGVAIIAYLLIRSVPESKADSLSETKFDWSGFMVFTLSMIAVTLVLSEGSELGWTNPLTLSLAAIFFIGFTAFYIIEDTKSNAYVDFELFNNSTYAGATLSNFLLSGAAGTMIITLALTQQMAGITFYEASLLIFGYTLALFASLLLGAKCLGKCGARRPMLAGSFLAALGLLLISLSLLYNYQYYAVSLLGFILFGFGFGLYVTPSTNAAIDSVPHAQVGAAAGIYQTASFLGLAFGVAISATIFTTLSSVETIEFANLYIVLTDNADLRYAAAVALLYNVFMTVVAIIAIMMTVPKGK